MAHRETVLAAFKHIGSYGCFMLNHQTEFRSTTAMKDKVIFIVTNDCTELGEERNKTGWYLPEAAYPYRVFENNGYEVVFVSPKGGVAPMDEGSAKAYKDDDECQKFLEKANPKLKNTLAADSVDSTDFVGIYYCGGHGPMFDLPGNETIAKLSRDIYENGGIIGACCHGSVGLTQIKLSNGDYLVKGLKVTSFTNAEEEGMKLTREMPFLLQDKLTELGADFVGKEDWTCNVQVSGRLVTGQNPNSAEKCAEAMVDLLKGNNKE